MPIILRLDDEFQHNRRTIKQPIIHFPPFSHSLPAVIPSAIESPELIDSIDTLIQYISHEVLNYCTFARSAADILFRYKSHMGIPAHEEELHQLIPVFARTTAKLRFLIILFTHYNSFDFDKLDFEEQDHSDLRNAIEDVFELETSGNSIEPGLDLGGKLEKLINSELTSPSLTRIDKLNLLLNAIKNMCSVITMASKTGTNENWGNKAFEKILTIMSSSEKIYEVIEDTGRLWNLVNNNVTEPHICSPDYLKDLINDQVQENAIKYSRNGIIAVFPDWEALTISHVLSLDINLLKYAIKNLINNACKYSQGNINVTLRIRGDLLEIQVEDFGIGIPDEALPFIGNFRYRVPGSENAAKGSGIGLNIVRRIAQVHKGTMHVTSQIGKGSTFTIAIPVQFQLIES